MKKTLYILSALILGLVSCNRTEFEPVETPKPEESGLVAITMKVQLPVELQATTKALGDRSDTPSIKSMRVAVFGTSGYPQAYALAEPIKSATDETPGSYATENGKEYYFKVLLPVYDGEAHVHIIANGDESIKFVDETEDSIMKTMKTQGNVGAYWARVILPDGILTQLDDNGIMQTDGEGNFIPSDGTAHLFEDLVLVRNFAEVRLSSEVDASELHDITWTLVNVPNNGSVAPMVPGYDVTYHGDYVYDFKDYLYYPKTGKMVIAQLDETTGKPVVDAEGNWTVLKAYDGYMFDKSDINYGIPDESAFETENGAFTLDSPGFVYERLHPGTDKATCILMRALYRNDTDWSYYRLDLTDERVGGYFPLYRNCLYSVKIHKVGNRGAEDPIEAMNRDSGGNVSLSTEASKLTDISDGFSRLYVEYVEKNFTSGGKAGLWVKYVPDVKTGTADNEKISLTIKDQGTALKNSTITLLPTSTREGRYYYEFELNDPIKASDQVSVLQVKADNGVVGEDNSTLYRDITLRVMKELNMTLSLKPKQVSAQGEITVLNIGLPDGLPSSMFPLEFYIEDINHTLYSTGKDGNGNSITVPVKTDKSLADGKTNSFYFIRTVSENEYKTNHTISTEFKTSKEASATTVYVANEYFKTMSTNLLNDGMYVNPTNTTVPFNMTSVKVQVEFYEPDGKNWTVTAGDGITSITDATGATIAGGTGNGTFVLNFPTNNSTTATVIRRAKVRYNEKDHDVTITQTPLEFSVTTDTPTIIASETTATVTVHAEEGKSWTAVITGPNGVTGYSLSESSGTGTKTLTVTLPENTTTNSHDFTITATMTDPVGRASETITQRRRPNAYHDFRYNDFGQMAGSYTARSSSDNYVTIALENCANGQTYGYGWYSYNYIQTSYNNQYGTITITPVNGMKISTVVITYSNNYIDDNPTLSTGSSTYNGNVMTWTVNSSKAVTYTSSNNAGYTNGRRITNIRVNYVAE
ncbi:MAG: hypothetical protein IJ161_11380 [Bacteroidales bacterium]|nr:hypothetical protein [Bacteroidales bacterium]